MNFKKMSGLCLLTGVFLGGTTAFANEQNVDKEPQAKVEVEGKLGFDNTNPEQPGPTDPNNWINVTVPNTIMYYTTDDNPDEIKSPNHSIVNHSGQKVEVYAGVHTYTVGGEEVFIPDFKTDFKIHSTTAQGTGNDMGVNVNTMENGLFLTLNGSAVGQSTRGTFRFSGNIDSEHEDLADLKDNTLSSTLELHFEPVVEEK